MGADCGGQSIALEDVEKLPENANPAFTELTRRCGDRYIVCAYDIARQ
jgi:hypothetical protein